ncbi:T6SS phospholipase effector Tle1-like catalytic domain-containing protein [Flavobacterium aquidurense]|uniref:Rhs element Vgr protein n=1 Tax=Flavobacterium aquidurense TaxID=362413 RepID=A0A0Q0Y1M9_9FLAO|nr:DUF2235 domain-containing protein [Flavobacterium aquidurense]KQB42632.1 Rhs element Vgr protein [Flavobacterium aquidurense]
MEKSFAYNEGSSQDEEKQDELRLTFGIFIDGTLNNKDNTEMRTRHSRTNKEGKIDYSKGNKELETDDEIEYKKIENKGRIEELLSKRNKTPAEEIEFKAIDEKTKYLVASHRIALNEFGLDRMGTDNSYSNDYTNVARMWQCCEQEDYAIYVPGMGTDNLMRDSTDGFAFGSGQTGIRARVRYACEQIADKVFEKKKNTSKKEIKIAQITVDIFGFSRGAATARNLVYELNLDYGYQDAVEKEIPCGVEYRESKSLQSGRVGIQQVRNAYVDVDNYEVDTSLLKNEELPKMGHLGYSLLKKTELDFDELKKIEITIRFVGIYDTVSSYYELNGIWDHYDAYGNVKDEGFKLHKFRQAHFNNDVEELHLNAITEKKSAGYNTKPQLNNLYCQKVVHFTAKDEHRENFALTRIKQKEGRYIEKNFPGVHCDIGGAYMTEKEVIDEIGTSLKDTDYVSVFPDKSIFLKEIAGLDLLREDLIRQYWYTEKQLKVKTQWSIPVYEKLTGTRGHKIEGTDLYEGVKKEYSYLFLHFMEAYARSTEMKEVFIEESSIKFPLDHFLTGVENYLKPYAMDETNEIEEWDFSTDEEIEKQKKEMLEREELETKIKSTDQKLKEHTYEYEGLKKVNDKIRKPYEPRIDLGTLKIPKEAVNRETELIPVALPELNVYYYNSQKMLRQLRNEYLHWSSNRDWFGMQPNEDRKRKIN